MDDNIGKIQVTDLNGKGPYTYKAHHLHFHGPSEHKIDGRYYDLEMHIVHELIDGPDKESYNE
jgi:carbonic anhydrase